MADGTESVAIQILSGLLSGGIASAALTYFFETRREDRNVKRSKLEELYNCYDEYIRGLLAVYRALKSYADQEIDTPTFFDRCHKFLEKRNEFSLHRVELIINMYFPHLSVHYRSLMFGRNKFDEILNNLPAAIENPVILKHDVDVAYLFFLEKDEETRKAILRTKV